MNVTRPLLLTVLLSVNAYAGTLEFNVAVPGTLADINGLGTGFTHRLPGTGAAIPANDANMDLLAMPGHLLLTSTRADINQGNPIRNLDVLEAPGVQLESVGANDILLSALFRNVSVPNASDQLELFIGTSSENVLRAGFHSSNIYIFTENFGAGDRNISTGADAFDTGDDVLLSLNRLDGIWSLSWQNLTNPPASGALEGKALPWLDGIDDYYAGVLASNAGSNTTFVGQIDYFAYEVVPEPSSVVLFVIGLLVSGWYLARHRHDER